VRLVGSCYTDISRCTVNKTLNSKYVFITQLREDLRQYTYCARQIWTAKAFPLLLSLCFIIFYLLLYVIQFTVPYTLHPRNSVT